MPVKTPDTNTTDSESTPIRRNCRTSKLSWKGGLKRSARVRNTKMDARPTPESRLRIRLPAKSANRSNETVFLLWDRRLVCHLEYQRRSTKNPGCKLRGDDIAPVLAVKCFRSSADLLSLDLEIGKPHLLFNELQLDGTGSAVALFSNNQVCHTCRLGLFVVIIIPMQENHQVGILFNCA